MIVLLAPAAFGTTLNPTQRTVSTDAAAVAPGKTVLLRLHADVAPGFHLYSLTTPEGGRIPTIIQLAPNPAVRNSVVYQPKPERRNDPTFNVPIELFLGSTDFLIAATLQDAIVEWSQNITGKPATKPVATGSACRPLSIPRKPELRSGRPHSFRYQSSPLATSSRPVLRRLLLPSRPPASRPRIRIFFSRLSVRIAGIFTLCVFHIVPLTVSYFLTRNPASLRAVLAQALLFCTGLIVLFSVLGFVGIDLRAFGVVQLSSSPWVNA